MLLHKTNLNQIDVISKLSDFVCKGWAKHLIEIKSTDTFTRNYFETPTILHRTLLFYVLENQYTHNYLMSRLSLHSLPILRFMKHFTYENETIHLLRWSLQLFQTKTIHFKVTSLRIWCFVRYFCDYVMYGKCSV